MSYEEKVVVGFKWNYRSLHLETRTVFLKNIVYDVKIEKTMKENWIRDELRTLPTPWIFLEGG